MWQTIIGGAIATVAGLAGALIAGRQQAAQHDRELSAEQVRQQRTDRASAYQSAIAMLLQISDIWHLGVAQYDHSLVRIPAAPTDERTNYEQMARMRLYGSPECFNLWRAWTAAADRCLDELNRWVAEPDATAPRAQAAYRDLNNARAATLAARNAVIDRCRAELGSPPATYGAALEYPDHHQPAGAPTGQTA